LLEAAHARTGERRLEPKSQRVAVAGGARDVKPHGHEILRHRVSLARQNVRVDRDIEVEPAPLTGGEAQCPEIE
jgi:hypothetical protein